MDNNRRYVSPRVRRKPFARASASISPGQFFQKEVSLPTLLTYRRFMSTKGIFREEGVAFTRSSPIKKAKQPHTSFPPAPSARSLGIPCKPPVASAIQSPRSLLFVAYLLHAIYCFLAIIWQILDGNSAAIAIFPTGIWQNITPGKSQEILLEITLCACYGASHGALL